MYWASLLYLFGFLGQVVVFKPLKLLPVTGVAMFYGAWKQ